MAENLKKTILIENEEYNINAVEADVAKETQAALTITRSIKGNDTDTPEDFNGSEAKSINYVPADGGTFTGTVKISKGNYSVDNNITKDDIINKGQMETIISKLDGAPLYTWNAGDDIIDPTTEDVVIKTGYNAVENTNKVPYRLNTVIGTIEDLPVFEAYSSGQASTLYVTPDSYDKAYIQYTANNEAWFNPSYMSIKDTITKLVIPGTNNGKSVKIKENAFQPYDTNDTKTFDRLETVHINPGVTAIGQAAFKDCDALKSIAIPDSVESIGGWAFENCTSLTTIILGSKITSILNGTFKNSGIKSIFIGSGVSNIHDKAFLSCDSLEKIYFAGTEEAWDNITGCTKDTSVNFKNLIITKTGEVKKTIPVICVDNANHSAFPFLYICKGPAGEDTSLTSNKMFLKMPGEPLVEISKGAARLERRDSKTSGNVDYFTYDVLAAVIAGINSRITALGSQALALPETLKVYDSETTAVVKIPTKIANESISTDSDKALIVEETVVPTVQQLQQQLTNITGLTQDDAYANENDKTTSVMQAKADETGRNIQTGYYRKTMNDFTKDAGIEQANTITISSSIPTTSTLGQIGDIMIVINTDDSEV